MRPLTLADLREAIGGVIHGDPATQVRGVTLSSRSVRAEDLYAALPGARTHGGRFAGDAAGRGAVAILTDADGAALSIGTGLPSLVVEEPRRILGEAAAVIYGHPATSLKLIGVTGTQGKTTTTQLIVAGLAGASLRPAVVGTMGTWIDSTPVSSALTTPEAPDLHALFAVMVEHGVDVCALEVSSHALVMGRVDGVVFDLAVFTNLGRDHLDFHADVEDYFAAKAMLFTRDRAKRALVNVDDAYGARLLDSPEIETHTFSATGREADWAVTLQPDTAAPGTFAVTGPGGRSAVMSVAMPGDFNVANALCAVAAIGELGVDVEAAARGIAAAPAVPGRMERIDEGQPFTVIVDYAHKPDAVAATLNALRPSTARELVIVIGAGGDRDAGKRPMMGEIASRLADLVVVTDDNPRSEDPAAIRAEIVAGMVTGAGSARVRE
ncbi:MAG: UDP-N-acetylmuramoyl-L-alanyl-D-glutamate--2,6-diaminopimelate ligase, partial [Nocardioidaceae bacterium]|nr:UDP-N-acetylmuramoyl-L-alanyl-D-glutamate--2,6-diaminopimelate ligase [Nocardioidaceae bacterium]